MACNCKNNWFRFNSSQRLVTVATATSTPLCAAAANRIRIEISCPVTNRITVSFADPAVLDSGANVYPASNTPYTLDRMLHGEAATRPLFGIAAVADQVVSVLEVFGESADAK